MKYLATGRCMKYLAKGTRGQELSSQRRRLLPTLSLLILCLPSSVLVLGCSGEDMESFRVATPTTPGQVTVPEPIPPQQTVGGPADLFTHQPAGGESETVVLPPGGGGSLPRGAPVAESQGPTLGEIAPTIIAAAQPAPSQGGTQAAQLVDLTLPVSLPQTGPAGTVMSFGVEYRLLAEVPRDQTYAWVIQSRTGKVFRLDGLQLDRKGSLMTIVAEWRPEDGPFCTWIEDAAGRPVSRKLDF
ncbi:MAG: hypothetical protein GYA33_01495 [Thermogutta sp.]|nr:hypothetical protein [Thermogutta sp.]